MTTMTRKFIASVRTVLGTQMLGSDDPAQEHTNPDHRLTDTREWLTNGGQPVITSRATETPDADHCTLLPRIGTEVLGLPLLSLVEAGETGESSSPLGTVPQTQHYQSLRELRRTDEFRRLRRYLGRHQQSVSFKPRSATILEGETGSGDRLEVAVANVTVRGGAHDEAFFILGRVVGESDLVAAGIEYVETETRSPDELDGVPSTDDSHSVTVCVSMKAVDALGEIEEQRITLDPQQPTQQPAD